MTRIVTCGSRDYERWQRVYQILDAAVERLGMTALAEGGQSGWDWYAKDWVTERKWAGEHQTFKAAWHRFGLQAGPMRNGAMLRDFKPDIVIAGPPGPGGGTRNCVKQAEDLGIKVIKVDW